MARHTSSPSEPPHAEPLATPGSSPLASLRAVRRVQPLGVTERFFFAQDALAPTHLARVILLASPPSPARVQRALRQLAARHPLLCARVVSDPEPSFVHDAAAAPALHVLPRTGPSSYEAALQQLLNARFREARGSHLSAHYLYTEGSAEAELIVIADHVICDGVSMNALCAELMQLCAGQTPRLAAQLRPVLEHMLPAATPVARARAFAHSLLRLGRISALRAVLEPRARPRTTATAFTELTTAQTEALVVRARHHDSTVTGALMAAALRAVKATRRTGPRLAVSVPVNLRPRLPEQGLTPGDLANLTTAAYLDSAVRGSFWELACTLRGDLARTLDDERLLNAVIPVYATGRALLRSARPPLAHAMISNSGTLPLASDYGAFRVRGFRSATSAPMLSADVSLFCNTFAGRLCINLVYAEEVLGRAEAERVLALIHTDLVEDP